MTRGLGANDIYRQVRAGDNLLFCRDIRYLMQNIGRCNPVGSGGFARLREISTRIEQVAEELTPDPHGSGED